MHIAGAGDFDIMAGHVVVEAGGSEPAHIVRGRLHVRDDGTWRAQVELRDAHLEAEDVEVNFTGDLSAWSGRAHIVAQSKGSVDLESDEALVVLPAVGA